MTCEYEGIKTVLVHVNEVRWPDLPSPHEQLIYEWDMDSWMRVFADSPNVVAVEILV